MTNHIHAVPEQRVQFKDRDEAEVEVCLAISSLGRLAGIDVDLGDGPEDIDGTLIQATYESNFVDPEFLGGPGCFTQADAPADVLQLATRASRITYGLGRYIRRHKSLDAIHQAQSCIAMVDAAFAWLHRQSLRTSH
ncbi:MAG: hypothetical protein M3Y65_07955 [Pseudomonadota bacterium]|nr:hypothetical protein [Pseudomonadota bacterium]